MGKAIVLLFLCMCHMSAVAHEHARLLLLSKEGKYGFALPITHYGVKAESDDYFNNIVINAAKASDVIFDESADKFILSPVSFKKCRKKDQLNESLQNDIRKNFLIMSKYDEFPLLKFNPNPNLFTMAMIVLLGPIQFDTSKKIDEKDFPNNPLVLGIHNEIVNKLEKIVKRRYPIENFYELFDMYCSMGVQDKNQFLKLALDNWNGISDDKNGRNLDELYENALAQISGKLEKTTWVKDANRSSNLGHLTTKPVPSFDKFILDLRNRAWIKHVSKNISKEKIPFYALGAFHFVSNDSGPGLIDLLKKDGYQVKLIHTLDDLPKEIKDRISSQSK